MTERKLVAEYHYIEDADPRPVSGWAALDISTQPYTAWQPPYVDFADELRRFNDARREMLNGNHPTNDDPMPLEPTGVGGDVGPPE